MSDTHEDTGEPFCIMGSYEGTYIKVKTLGEHYIKLCRKEINIKTIDPKYLPNSNIINGSSEGSLRTIGTSEENDDYTMGKYSFAEGRGQAFGNYSHAEGYAIAYGEVSHAEGSGTIAEGNYSHAGGINSKALGRYSFVHGEGVVANNDHGCVIGSYNLDDGKAYGFVVGNGSWDGITYPSNAYTLDFGGNAWFAGDVYVGSTSGTNKDEGSVMVAKIVSSTTEVADGDASPYPEGTLYVVISE